MTDDVSTFRKELRTWLEANLTPEFLAAAEHGPEGENLETLREWNRLLADAGWAAPVWPSEYGGKDADLDEQIAYFEEMSRSRASGPVNVIAVSNIAPAIMQYGTEEQKDRYLGPLLRGDEIWSQGMSEPDAGSDLAGLRCTAVRDGDEFILNGQKTWNSLGQHADFCQIYVRTDPDAPKHKGITCLLIDMKTPGIEVRPLKTITGDEPFAEVFLTDARVPVSSILGPLNQGWTVAMTTLSFERAGVARLHLMLSRRFQDLLADPGAAEGLGDPVLRERVARMYSDLACLRWMSDRALDQMRTGQPTGSTGSLAKIAWSRAEQKLANLAVDLLGMNGLSGRWATNLASARQLTIAGGTTEINLNIVAEHGLGLPREPNLK